MAPCVNVFRLRIIKTRTERGRPGTEARFHTLNGLNNRSLMASASVLDSALPPGFQGPATHGGSE